MSKSTDASNRKSLKLSVSGKVLKVEQELYESLIVKIQTEAQEIPKEAQIRQWGFEWLSAKKIPLPESAWQQIIDRVVFSIVGLGPIESLIRDDSVSEIMVNGPQHIFVERNGMLQKTVLQFSHEEQLLNVINQIVGKVGRRIDESNPLVDARLEDGSRVNAIIRPLALSGPTLTIRKFPKQVFSMKNMLQAHSLTKEMSKFLQQAVVQKRNILISGGTGAGKTSTLNACAAMIPNSERIITIEDAAEIRIDHPHLISLEARAANIEQKGEISIRMLLKNSLRMRPDRIVVGEIRGKEAIDMLQAMNTGHQGSLTTVHANSPLESLFRVETMVLMGDIGLPIPAIRSQVISAIDLIIQQERLSDGSRKITKIAQLEKNLDSRAEYTVKDLFWFDKKKGEFNVAKKDPFLSLSL